MPKASRPDPIAAHVGAVIQRLRVQRGWTQTKLAQRSGMNATHLGLLEKGGNVPTLRTILEIADVLGVSAAEIVREVEEALKQ